MKKTDNNESEYKSFSDLSVDQIKELDSVGTKFYERHRSAIVEKIANDDLGRFVEPDQTKLFKPEFWLTPNWIWFLRTFRKVMPEKKEKVPIWKRQMTPWKKF